MYAILIINAIGNIKCWAKGTKRECDHLCKQLPANGWTLFKIVVI